MTTQPLTDDEHQALIDLLQNAPEHPLRAGLERALAEISRLEHERRAQEDRFGLLVQYVDSATPDTEDAVRERTAVLLHLNAAPPDVTCAQLYEDVLLGRHLNAAAAEPLDVVALHTRLDEARLSALTALHREEDPATRCVRLAAQERDRHQRSAARYAQCFKLMLERAEVILDAVRALATAVLAEPPEEGKAREIAAMILAAPDKAAINPAMFWPLLKDDYGSHWAAKLLALSLERSLGAAPNFMEVQFRNPRLGLLTVTIQKPAGSTPAQQIAALRAERDASQADLEALRARHAALREAVDQFMKTPGFLGLQDSLRVALRAVRVAMVEPDGDNPDDVDEPSAG